MNQIFQDNSPLVIGVKKVLDIVLLDVLWLLTSIPVVTIGMSTTAFYDVAYRDIWHGRGMVVLDYFASCKRNFRQSMAAGVLYAAMTAVLVVDVSLLRAMADQGAGWGGLWVPVAVFAGLLAVYFVWVAANIARFQAPLKTILKNALALGLAHLPVSGCCRARCSYCPRCVCWGAASSLTGYSGNICRPRSWSGKERATAGPAPGMRADGPTPVGNKGK